MSKINIKCSCGSENFEIPPNPKSNDSVKCSKCGATGNYGEVMKSATAKAKQIVESQLKDALRKAGFK